MQPSYVMAFRKRLYNRGYNDIKIKRCIIGGVTYWSVTAYEPLADTYVSRICSVNFLINSFR